jgi:hypothetical protein
MSQININHLDKIGRRCAEVDLPEARLTAAALLAIIDDLPDNLEATMMAAVNRIRDRDISIQQLGLELARLVEKRDCFGDDVGDAPLELAREIIKKATKQ